MAIKIIKNPIKKSEVAKIASEVFGDMVKIVVDVSQEIMAMGGELHADEEVMLTEKEGSKRENTWGFNIYPEKSESDWLEFDSMVNIKPHLGNRSREIQDSDIKEKIRKIVKKLIVD